MLIMKKNPESKSVLKKLINFNLNRQYIQISYIFDFQ